MKQEDIKKILEIGVQLSAERDLNRLLEQILKSVMELTRCDAGTLYLLYGDELRFRIMRNDTLKTYSGGDGQDPGLPPVALRRENVCAFALLEGRTVRIEDVKNCKAYDFSGPARYDEMTGYDTHSMLVVPMCNREGEKIGVLQLINALDESGQVCAFDEDMVLLVESVASQAAITIQNVRYIREIKELFQSFVKVMSSAVDERTPYNGSHTRHMAACGKNWIDYLNGLPGQRHFSQAEEEELLMGIWFHDIGKLVTPLEVMNKMNRLLPEQHTAFLHRMEILRLQGRIDVLAGRMSEEELVKLGQEIEAAIRLVEEINQAGFLTDEKQKKLEELASKTYRKENGETDRWLAPGEYAMLSIRKGTLSGEERKIMEEHVVITDKLLSKIHFSGELSHVRAWAASHHELLNGKGYPRHLAKDEIPYEVRMITILDIFDALVADDRPYKRGMPVEKALSILRENAQRGELDEELVELFAESRCWENAGR